MNERRVLVVDDDPGICRVVDQLLSPEGFVVQAVGTGRGALEVLRGRFRGVIILDVRLPDVDGPAVFEQIKTISPDNPVIFLTGYGSTDLALSAIREGAYDFLDKDELAKRLTTTTRQAFASMGVQVAAQDSVGPAAPEAPVAYQGIVTESREMQAVFRALRNAIQSSVTVLIHGESGTGKELIARAIHDSGPRRDGPFVAINCAGIPENLLEAELFGYERGAFTGAVSRKRGRYELAHKGTLLLDEIGELHPALQAKILRVIQEGEFQRLGGTETLRADVRVLSATHRNLEREVQVGRFREDLYYRLAVFTVYVPPLRERTGDTRLLAEHFSRVRAEREGKRIDGIEPKAMELLETYNYPGNVRELQNLMAYAVVSARGHQVTIADLPPNFLRAVSDLREQAARAGSLDGVSGPPPDWSAPAPEVAPAPAAAVAASPPPPASDAFPTIAQMEERLIREAVERTEGNKAEAARLLGISRVTLYRKLKTLDLD